MNADVTATQVLLSGENKELLGTLARILSAEGYKPLINTENDALLQNLSTPQPPIIVLDIFLFPSKTARTISAIRKQSNAPLIVLTGEYEAGELKKMLGNESYEILYKPFRMKELLDRIGKIITPTGLP